MLVGPDFAVRSIYRDRSYPIPAPFEALRQAFALAGLDSANSHFNPHVEMAENLCRRMGHIDHFAQLITDELYRKVTALARTATIETFLVGHFMACKALVDAVAIILQRLHDLELKGGNLDMNKPVFWRNFHDADEAAHDRFDAFRKWIQEVTLWRDAVVHRIPPFTVCSGPNPPDGFYHDDETVVMTLKPDVTMREILTDLGSVSGSPLHYHHLWRGQLFRFVGEACKEIEISLHGRSMPPSEPVPLI